MLHTKFQGLIDSGVENDLGVEKNLKVLTIYGHGGHIGHTAWAD